MKATHRDYQHPGHLRAVTGESYLAWSVGRGWHRKDALCVAPSASIHAQLNRASLPRHG